MHFQVKCIPLAQTYLGLQTIRIQVGAHFNNVHNDKGFYLKRASIHRIAIYTEYRPRCRVLIALWSIVYTVIYTSRIGVFVWALWRGFISQEYDYTSCSCYMVDNAWFIFGDCWFLFIELWDDLGKMQSMEIKVLSQTASISIMLILTLLQSQTLFPLAQISASYSPRCVLLHPRLPRLQQ